MGCGQSNSNTIHPQKTSQGSGSVWKVPDNETVFQRDTQRRQCQFDKETNLSKSNVRVSLDNFKEEEIHDLDKSNLSHDQGGLQGRNDQYMDNPGNPSRRGENAGKGKCENKSKKTESEHRVVKQKFVLLYVRIQQLIDEKCDIKAFLQARMESGKDFKFEVRNKELVQGHTVFFLEFESQDQANSAVNLLKLSNRGSQMKLLCTFSREEAMNQPVEKDEEGLKKQISKIRVRAESVLENHQEKINLMTMQIECLSAKLSKFIALDEFEYKRIEREALNDKQTELTKQREQFDTYLNGLINKIKEVWENNTDMKHIPDLRNDFSVECCHLENALPVYARRNDIIRIVKENQVSVILRETGSGKSTQITQYLHQAGISKDGIIVCTQPRQVAAISLATHVASEMATNVGNVVGYKVGMKTKLGGATKILYMTDHCLLNECLKDPSLSAYSCVIVDKAHERSIYTELLLGMLKMCLKQRPELKAIITSATIDSDVFVHYFGGCPVLRVSGRMFPVEVVYEPNGDGGKAFDKYVEHAVNKAVSIHKEEGPGDVLVFVTTPLETEKCSKMLENRLRGRTDFKCLILHSQTRPEVQQMVFQTSAAIRKIVFATNSAETSITIPGIKYVIDTGLVKEKRYDSRRNMSSLSVVVISRSSAEQRKGRAGRTGPGKCYRLYSEELYREMDAVSQPEILKVHLGQAMLKLTELGIDPTKYDFIQSPGPSAIEITLQTLEEFGAIKDKKITKSGKELAKLPVEPRLGLIIQKGRSEGIFFDAIVLAAVSSMGNSIFYRGGSDEDKKEAGKLKLMFCHSGGDSLTLLNVYRMWIKQPENQQAKWCFDNSLNAKAIRIVRDTINELAAVIRKETKLTVKHEFHNPEMVDQKLQKILFDSYVSNICHFLGHSKAGYYAAKLDQQVHPHPSSVLNLLNMEPEWLVFEQSLKTSKDFITGLTPVNESWVLEAIESGRLKRNLEEMRNKALVPVHTEHVGLHLFWKIVGPCFTKLRIFEATASDLVKPALAVIEASKDKGELKVFSSEPSTGKLSQLFQTEISTVRESLKAEDLESPLNQKNKSSIRVVLGPGGAVKEVLMPDEYRTVFVEKTDRSATEDSVLGKFCQFGKIKENRMFKKNVQWGCITFECSDSAKVAVKKTACDSVMVAVPGESGRGFENSDFKVKITWCRRESKGIAYANVEPEEVPKLLRRGYIDVRGIRVTIRQCEDQQSLFLRNLGPDITEEDIKKALLTALRYDTPMRVTVVRKRVDTSQQQLDIMKQQLQENIKNYSQDGQFNVEIKPPFQGSRMFLAFATFTDANEGIAACQGLSKQMTIFGREVTMEPDIKSSLFISKEVYGAIQEDLDHYIQEEFPTFGYSEVTIKQRIVNHGTVVIDIHASNALEVAKVRASLQKIVQGDTLEWGTTANLRHLLTKTGRSFLKVIEKKYGAYIQADGRTQTVCIRGKQEARTLVIKALTNYLHELVEGECMEVNLRGEHKPKGLMKALINEYGLELEKLQAEIGLRSIILNFKQQVMKMTGSVDSITKATTIIDRVIANIQEDVKMSADDEPECIVCLCPIEDKDLYRLEYCGHGYCLDCLKRQVECAVKDKEFPLLCGQDGCEEQFMWRDLSNLMRQGSVTATNLTSSALSSYVKRNSIKYHYCPTPNCCMVYRVTSSGAVFHCSECNTRICTSCHTQSHDGITCELYQSKLDEGKMKLWLAANSKTTKKCPKCQIPIEKVSGCNRMVCAACTCIFCWLCLKAFSTGGDCHRHFYNVH